MKTREDYMQIIEASKLEIKKAKRAMKLLDELEAMDATDVPEQVDMLTTPPVNTEATAKLTKGKTA